MAIIKEINEKEENDDFMKGIMASKGIDWQPLSEDNWEQELNQIPLFMNDISQQEIDSNPQLKAFHELINSDIIEGETLNEVLETWKLSGNEIFKEAKEFKQKSGDKKKYVQAMETAIQKYTQGIILMKKFQNEPVSLRLKISLFLNRAAVNLDLQNYKSCKMDCSKVIQLFRQADQEEQTQCQSLLIKACYRFSKCCLETNYLNDALQCIEYALSVDPKEESTFSDIKQQVDTKLQLMKYQEELDKKRQNIQLMQKSRLQTALIQRSISVCEVNWLNADENQFKIAMTPQSALFSLPQGFDYKPELSDDSLLVPVVVVYPQPSTFDVLQKVDENTRWKDLIQEILTDRDDFNFEGSEVYNVQNVSLYLPVLVDDRIKWTRVSMMSRVINSLQTKDYTFPEDGAFRIWLCPSVNSSQGEWTSNWLSQY